MTLTANSFGDLAAAEGSPVIKRTGQPVIGRRVGLAWVTAVVIVAAVGFAGFGRRDIVNPGGWPLFARFWRAALDPNLSGRYLADTGRGLGTTLAYTILSTSLSLLLGCFGGVVLSHRALSRRVQRTRPTAATRVLRFIASIPRGMHEAVWALLLLSVLGRDPLVAILAIGLPYGAITAKVYADMLDESAARQHQTLRTAGAGRLQALVYGTIPSTAADLASYAFYRFECAARAAVVLGMVGVGGIGFQLSQSFQGLAYRDMWTCLYALIALGAAAEVLGGRIRRQRRPHMVGHRRWGAPTALVGLVVASWLYLQPGIRSLWSSRTAQRLGRLLGESLPPKLPRGGWSELASASVATLHVSLLAIVGACILAVPLAVLSVRRRFRLAARFASLIGRSIPPPVWALLALFVLFPGVVPAAVALALYTAGVLARLFGESLDNADQVPTVLLQAAGAGRTASLAYGVAPTLAPRWAALALYRWEVAARDTAVVGVVGAGGLGRLLAEQTAGFAFPRMASTILALVVVTMLVDTLSSIMRAGLR